MKRSYSILPPFRPPWRYDLYQALFAALLVAPLAQRGEGRARELYRQSVMICERTGETLSTVVWALATFEHALRQSTAEEKEPLPSLHCSFPSRASPHLGFRTSKHPKQLSLSH